MYMSGNGAENYCVHFSLLHITCITISSLFPSPSLSQDIEECAALVEKECVALSPQLGSMRVLPLHGALGGATQQVYDSEADGQGPSADTDAQAKEDEEGDKGVLEVTPGPTLRRRVFLTDFLGEASFSLPSIRYVVDTGLLLKTVSTHTAGFSFFTKISQYDTLQNSVFLYQYIELPLYSFMVANQLKLKQYCAFLLA